MQIKAEDIITRLKSGLNLKNDAELSRVINIHPSTLSTWKARNTVDHNLVIAICQQNGLDLNSVFSGNTQTPKPTSIVEEGGQTYAIPKDSKNSDLLIKSLLKNIALLEERLRQSEDTIRRAHEREQRFNELQEELINTQAQLIESQKKLKSAEETIISLKKKKAA